MTVQADTGAAVLLCANAGSSSLKCALYRGRRDHEPRRISVTEVPATTEAFADVTSQLELRPEIVAHRVVHGGPRLDRHVIIDDDVLGELRATIPFAPLHLPAEIAAIEAAARLDPQPVQIACFDTVFHRTMSEVAGRLPLPRRFAEAGMRRYGFHGLSCEYIVAELGDDTLGQSIIAHLGSGASLTAVSDGASVDTTMGLTPLGGVIMATRTGDLDPGVVIELARGHAMDADAIEKLVTTESGLLGISGSTNDMHRLLERRDARPPDHDAALAVAAFCRSVRKQIGGLTTVLGRLDTLVFTGGIGEREPVVRAEICENLGHLGIRLDTVRNRQNDPIVSAPDSEVVVRVVRTDENLVMARHAVRLCLA